MDAHLFVADTGGLSVYTAVAAGEFKPEAIAEVLEKADICFEKKRLIIPGFAAPLQGKIEEKTGYEVLVGPEDSRKLKEFCERHL
jgi:acetyl-CoA decarbonylase/synthase complex subunit gamma